MKNKFFLCILTTALLLTPFGCGTNDASKDGLKDTATDDATQSAVTEEPAAPTETISLPTEELENLTTENTGNIESGQYTIDGIDFSFSDSVRHDTTGNWRISLISSSTTPDNYALDYYNTLFASDDEIHAVVNFSLNTTTRISVLYDGVLDVTVLEYIDGEEHDAKELFGGSLLTEYWIHTDTGEVEKIQ